LTEPFVITYRFQLPSGNERSFTVNFDRQVRYERLDPALPGWTRLDCHRCTVCTLTGVGHCPAAVDVQGIVGVFSSVYSYALIQVRVEAPERVYLKHCDAQTALRSLLGLVMATGQCPILAKFRGLARFHLPFATLEETLYRAVSASLLKSYFHLAKGPAADAPCDLGSLHRHYDQLQALNQCFCERVREAGEADASMNAMVGFFSISVLFSQAMQTCLERLRDMFRD